MSAIDWSKAPEGATHAGPETDDYHAGFYKVANCRVTHYCSVGERGWLEGSCGVPPVAELIERPSQAWDGEGLPPVGTVCEFNSCWAHFARGESWHQVTVVYSSDESYVVRRDAAPEGETTEVCGPATLSEIARFRPIRTAEQIASETRIAEINEMLRHIRDWPRGSHGVNHLSQLKIHEDACCDLYDAGYRKQESSK